MEFNAYALDQTAIGYAKCDATALVRKCAASYVVSRAHRHLLNSAIYSVAMTVQYAALAPVTVTVPNAAFGTPNLAVWRSL